MGVGHSQTSQPPPVAAKLRLVPGSLYEMDNPNSWHYVSPVFGPSISVMLIDAPWKEVHPFYAGYEKPKLGPLVDKDKQFLVSRTKLVLPSVLRRLAA